MKMPKLPSWLDDGSKAALVGTFAFLIVVILIAITVSDIAN